MKASSSLSVVKFWTFPALALLLIFYALRVADAQTKTTAPTSSQLTSAPTSDSQDVVAGLGLIEPSSEVVTVATELSGVARAVLVKPGDRVQKGAPLLQLDTRIVLAQIDVAKAAVGMAQVELDDASARLKLFNAVQDPRATSPDERDRARFAVRRANSTFKLRQAELQQLLVERDRLTVLSPMDGQILRVSIRAGEFAAVNAPELIAIGQLQPMHVRVQIDEEDAHRIGTGITAQGSLRGNPNGRIALRFIRSELQALPKRNLNGGAERVDTRVIELIYAFDPGADQVFIGQQMDVFVPGLTLPSKASPVQP